MLMMEEGHLIPLEKVQTREEVVEKLQEFVIRLANIEGIGILPSPVRRHESSCVVG